MEEATEIVGGAAARQGRLHVCVVPPAFNEARHLVAVVDGIPAWVDGIVIVDDASIDDTFAVAEALPDARVTIVHLDANEGVGGALVRGYRAALAGGFDIVVRMDAEEVPLLVRPLALGMAEYTKGNRFRQTSRPRDVPRRPIWRPPLPGDSS